MGFQMTVHCCRLAKLMPCCGAASVSAWEEGKLHMDLVLGYYGRRRRDQKLLLTWHEHRLQIQRRGCQQEDRTSKPLQDKHPCFPSYLRRGCDNGEQRRVPQQERREDMLCLQWQCPQSETCSRELLVEQLQRLLLNLGVQYCFRQRQAIRLRKEQNLH
jgi:hypothetical protein